MEQYPNGPFSKGNVKKFTFLSVNVWSQGDTKLLSLLNYGPGVIMILTLYTPIGQTVLPYPRDYVTMLNMFSSLFLLSTLFYVCTASIIKLLLRSTIWHTAIT